jgi:hypothetical protein
MKYYITKIDVRAGDRDSGEPAVVVKERVLTKPSNFKAAKYAAQRYEAMGIENVFVNKHKASRYNKLMKAQRKKPKPVTVQDIVEGLGDS